MKADLFGNVTLEGDALNVAVATVLGLFVQPYSSDWAAGGPLIESNQLFIDAPHETHVNYGYDKKLGRTKGEWLDERRWTATVSAAVRTKPNPNFPLDGPLGHMTCVGRGAGPTCLIAAMRAIVDSFPDAKP
jgi:hypothetical protein